MSLLELDHITKRFGAVVAVNNVSTRVEEGETLGIMGPNGSGKTTLLNLIMGVYPVTEGDIRLAGETICGLTTDAISRRGIGRTFQIPQPFLRMTVLENLIVGDLYGTGHRSIKTARIKGMEVLERVGLAPKATLEARQLGLLDLKRLELAKALSLKPRLLLLDEIAAGLVETEVTQLQNLILELKKSGLTILIIEHILSVIFGLSDRIIVLNFGQKVEEGGPAAIGESKTVQEIYLGTKSDKDAGATKNEVSSAQPAAESLLSVKHVNSGYGDFQVLFDVSLEVPKGEIVGLIGVNGAGKSTLIRTIARQLPVTAGEIIFNGKNINAARPFDMVGLGMAQCIEGRKLFPELTVEENLEIGAYSRKARTGRRSTMKEVYELFPRLWDRRTQVVSTLSGGEQQMVAIGRALMARPELIMFDELSLGLAPIVIDILYEAIKKINELGMTIVLVEQNVHRSLQVVDRAYIIERGRIVLSGAAADLATDQHVKEAYFGL